tara:strand:+ start:62 stop:619 length:558 start_codon:yes stop_codon:yes gene_type:complete
MYNPLLDLVHEYDFHYSNILKPYIKDILQDYEYNKKQFPTKLTTDITLDPNIPVIKQITKELEQLVQENYYMGKPMGESILNVYIQNDKSNTSKLHDHTEGFGTINGVFYLNPPKEGGEILFRHLENTEWGSELKLKPKMDKIYLFPYYLPHKPLPQTSPNPRLCFNYTYPSNDRPVHKHSRINW